jgi:hypothetical protein
LAVDQQGRYGNAEMARVATETHPSELEAQRAAQGVLPEAIGSAQAPLLGEPPPGDVQAVLRRPGTPLSGETRDRMEETFGRSFEDVRIHDDGEAARSAGGLGARAYAAGEHVVFADGEYRPATSEGDAVLRHELTHVAQQDGRDRDARPDAISLWPFPGPAQPRTWSPPGRTPVTGPGPTTPPSPPPPPPKIEPVDLEGMGVFRPPYEIETAIKEALGAPVMIPVEFGILAGGAIPVLWDGHRYQTPPPSDPDWGGHPIGIDHFAFKILTGARPVVAVNIRNSVVTGFLGWMTGKQMSMDAPAFFAAHPLHELFGWEGLTTMPPIAGSLNSELKGGALRMDIDPFLFTSGVFNGRGRAWLRNDKFDFDAWFDLPVKGLPSRTRLPIRRDSINRLFSGKSLRFDRSMGAAGQLTGEIIGTFADGKVDVRGTLKYFRSKPKVSGTVTVIVGSIDVAEQAVRSRLGPDAPAVIDTPSPDDTLAVTGWGHVDFDFNEWFKGNAEVIVHPEGYVTARGELNPTAVIPIGRRKTIKKNLFHAAASAYVPSLSVANIAGVSVSGSVDIDGDASIGPGAMHDMRVKGLYSTHPEIVNTFEFAGTVSVPAVAGIDAKAVASVSGEIGVTDPEGKTSLKLISTSLIVKGRLELQMYAEAQAQAGRRKSPTGEPEYFVKGTLTAGAGLKLAVDATFTVDLTLWSKDVPLHNRTYTLGGASVTVEGEYVFGRKGKEGDFSLKLNTGTFNQDTFLDAVMRGDTIEENYAAKQQEEAKLNSDPNPAAPKAPDLADTSAKTPDPTAGHRKIAEKVETAFIKMAGVDHRLTLRLSDPPALDMQSVLEPLLRKVRKEQNAVKKDKKLYTEERESRLAALAAIQASAEQVQASALAAARNPAYITPKVTGFPQLAQLIEAYGNNYNVGELGEALAKLVVDPEQPKSILKAFPGLQSDPKMVEAVEAILEADVEPDVLAKIVKNVKSGWWDSRDKEDVARDLLLALKKMTRTNASRWSLVIKDLAIGGTMAKGAEFVVRFIDKKLGWGRWISFEVSDADDGRRWDAWISGELFQFKAWGSFYPGTFLKQMREDLRRVHNEGKDDANLPLTWVFDGRIPKATLVAEMESALDEAVATQPYKHGWNKTLVKFMKARLNAVVKVVKW